MAGREREIVLEILNNANVEISLIKLPPGILSEDELQILQNGGIELSGMESANMSMINDLSGMYNLDIDDEPVVLDKINAVKKTYQKHCSALKVQNQRLIEENHRLVRDRDLEIERLMQEMRLATHKDGWELNQLRSEALRHENLFPLVKEALTVVREMMNGLVPLDSYLRLKNIPLKDLNPNEWVLVNTYELISPYVEENKKLKLENSTLRDEIRLQNEKAKQLLMELEHYQRLISERDDDYKRYNINYDNQKKSLEQELKKAYDEMRLLRTKSNEYDERVKECQKKADEIEVLKNKVRLLTPIDRDEAPGPFNTDFDLRRKIELLENEKMFLSKEHIKDIEVNKRLEDKNFQLETELSESKKTVEKYLQELLTTKHNADLSYEKRLNDDLASLRDKSNRELELTKNNLSEIYEKQIRFLKDQKEDLEFKVSSLTSQLREKQTQYEDLLKDNRSFQGKLDHELGELRVNSRVRGEELERLRIQYEDAKNEIRVYQSENEMLKDKLSIMRSEFYKNDAARERETSDIRSQNTVLREKLKNYENIENEIDNAIMGYSGDNKDPEANLFLQSLKTAPTSTQRRVQQSLTLAQRLQKKQGEIEELNSKLKAKEEELIEVQDELNIARELLDKTKQPNFYLIENLEVKERETLALRQKVLNLENEKDYLTQNYADLQSRFEESQLKIKSLLLKRENIDQIQNLLLNMIENNQYMDEHDMRAQLNEINLMVKEQPTRDDIKFYNTADSVNPLMNTKKMGSKEATPSWYKQLTSKKKR